MHEPLEASEDDIINEMERYVGVECGKPVSVDRLSSHVDMLIAGKSKTVEEDFEDSHLSKSRSV